MGRGFKRDSKCRTNTHNLVWRHHSWWNCLFKTFKDEIRILSDVNVRFLRIKSETSLEFEWNWPQYKFQYTMYKLLDNVVFDISHRWYFLCNVIMISNFLPTFKWNQYKMLMSAKGPAYFYFQTPSCCFIDDRLKLLCIKFASN